MFIILNCGKRHTHYEVLHVNSRGRVAEGAFGAFSVQHHYQPCPGLLIWQD